MSKNIEKSRQSMIFQQKENFLKHEMHLIPLKNIERKPIQIYTIMYVVNTTTIQYK